MAILGYNTSGASQTANSGNRILVSSFTLASPGTLTELHMWVRGNGSTAGETRIVIYDDDGSGGLPGTRLAYTNGLTIPVPTTDAEVSQTGFSVALTAGTYWLGFAGSDTLFFGNIRMDATGWTHQGISAGASYSPPPNPFGTPDTSGTRKLSVWGVVGATPTTFVPTVTIL